MSILRMADDINVKNVSGKGVLLGSSNTLKYLWVASRGLNVAGFRV